MFDALDLSVGGEPVRLLADRALYWPAMRRLFIADLHLGKGDTFRAAGIPVPSGGTARDLSRLASLLARTRPESLWILGDFLHARRNPRVDTAWRQFRDEHPQLGIAVLPGNHDRALDADAAGVDVIAEGTRTGPFVLHHAPPAIADETAHILCGHLHPVLRLPGEGQYPLFWLRPDTTVLPAFSAFTGGMAIAPNNTAGSVVCNGDALLQLGQGRFEQRHQTVR